MQAYTRRRFLKATSGGLLSFYGTNPAFASYVSPAEAAPNTGLTYDEWMDEAIRKEKQEPTKSLEGTLQLSRFVEPIYYLTAPTSWKPNAIDERTHHRVDVPRGFVTDLASIPRIFFSVLRPDGEYCHAAIIHDYLYWTQQTTRQEADAILRMAMLDSDVSSLTLNAIFKAVETFGQSSWDKNQSLRQSGEKRILKEFPTSPVTRWKDWRRLPGVFV